jgi:hypothetical protein
MNIIPVTDPAFEPYGGVVTGYPVDGLLKALEENTPCPEGTVYFPKVDALHAAPDAAFVGDNLFGGMPYELGCCNGHNTSLNCLEYHRDSEFNLGTEDFILLLAKMDDIENDMLDTAKVKAFFVPKGVLVEVYATTLHYAPCHNDPAKGFRVLVGLPAGTNTDYRPGTGKNTLDKALWARNKWLLAHPESGEAAEGAYVGLKGVNLDIQADIPFVK